MASKGVNKMCLLGNVGNDPEVRYMNGGECVVQFTVATGDYWRDKATGEPREETEWHRVKVYGKLAEIARDKVTKGAQVYLEAKSRTRSFLNPNGSGEMIHRQEFVLEGYQSTLQVLKDGNRPRSQSLQQQ
ncbi:single-stranded DNA-binding protein [Vibrio vulnificus]